MASSFRLFCIGASAGGHAAVLEVLKNIDPGINAAFAVVLHAAIDSPTNFGHFLQNNTKLKVETAETDTLIEAGKIYLSKPNNHLFIQGSTITRSMGPRENLFRPSIDVLFRSAAVGFNSKCVGVLLTGRLNDGTSGLEAIKRCGGLAIIQNPETAEFSDMPSSAQEFVEIDYILNLEKIGAAIKEICQHDLPVELSVPESIVREANIAMKIKSQVRTEESLGDQVPLSCASCGGPLWKMKESGIERYRCHVGHSFTQEALLKSQNDKLEETLWVSLRTFEEKKMLLRRMAEEYAAKGFKSIASSYRNKEKEVTTHITRLRELMQLNDQ